MREVILSNGKGIALVDDEDFDFISKWKWYLHIQGYAARRPRQGVLLMHREILRPDPGLEVDHINRNKLDNRRSNLREVTHSANLRNSIYKTNKSGFKGVFFDKKRRLKPWVASSTSMGKMVWLGSYATAEEASTVYQDWLKSVLPQDWMPNGSLL